MKELKIIKRDLTEQLARRDKLLEEKVWLHHQIYLVTNGPCHQNSDCRLLRSSLRKLKETHRDRISGVLSRLCAVDSEALENNPSESQILCNAEEEIDGLKEKLRTCRKNLEDSHQETESLRKNLKQKDEKLEKMTSALNKAATHMTSFLEAATNISSMDISHLSLAKEGVSKLRELLNERKDGGSETVPAFTEMPQRTFNSNLQNEIGEPLSIVRSSDSTGKEGSKSRKEDGQMSSSDIVEIDRNDPETVSEDLNDAKEAKNSRTSGNEREGYSCSTSASIRASTPNYLVGTSARAVQLSDVDAKLIVSTTSSSSDRQNQSEKTRDGSMQLTFINPFGFPLRNPKRKRVVPDRWLLDSIGFRLIAFVLLRWSPEDHNELRTKNTDCESAQQKGGRKRQGRKRGLEEKEEGF